MKKSIIISVLILGAFSANAQDPFIGFGAGKTAYHANAGILLGNVSVQALYSRPYSSAARPCVFNLSLGYQVNVGNVNVTPSLGAGALRYEDFTRYTQKDGWRIDKVRKTAIIPGLEVGRDWYQGRLYFSGIYANGLILTVGMKYFPIRKTED